MTKRKSFFSTLRRLTLCLMVLFMFNAAVGPGVAQAGVPVFDPMNAITKLMGDIKKAAEWVMKETYLGKIIATFVKTYNMLKNMFGKIGDTVKTSGVIQSMSQRLQAETLIKAHDATQRAKAEDALAAARAGYISRHAPPPHQELCKTILIHQLVTTTEDFAREISRMTAEAVSNRSRSYTDGSGVDHAALQHYRRCSQKRMGPVDGIPTCMESGASKTESTLGGDGVDIDIGPVRDQQIYEVPMFETKMYTDPKTLKTTAVQTMKTPGADQDAQRFFIAAVDHLFLAVGPRPTPLNGEKMQTPKGIAQRAMFNHCAASENALIKQCTDSLAYHTRPNKGSQGEDLRKLQEGMCLALEGTVDLKRFGECKEGLSAYEIHELTEMWCSSVQHAIGLKAAGVTDDKVRKASNLCEESRLTWRSLVSQQRLNCVSAMATLPALRQCWNTVEALAGGQMSSNDNGSAQAANWKTVPEANDNVPEKASVHQIKATKLKQSFPQGEVLSFDEIELPVAVGQ